MRPSSLLLALSSFACSDKGGDSGSAGGDGGDATAEVCTEATAIECTDQIILDLTLHDDLVADDADVTTTTDGDDFVTYVDATAGGYGNETENPWVYVKFTAEGAERVDIDDETALESMDWDMALRRFIIRLNGGDSGPSCVGVASLFETEYGDVDTSDTFIDALSFEVDDYYTSDCSLINDSSGLPNSPQVAMGAWWTYESCVQTSGRPQIIQLADGHVLKLVVEEYYAEDQDVCNSTGSGGSDSANITMRWQMIR
jgi:HmuY protein